MSQSPWGLAMKAEPESRAQESEKERVMGTVHIPSSDAVELSEPELPFIPLSIEDTENIYQHQRHNLIGIGGFWYDVTSYVTIHPGGDVIRAFLGKDATSVFTSIHHRNVLDGRTPVARYHSAGNDAKCLELLLWMKRRNYFQLDHFWTARRILAAFSLLVISVCLIRFGSETWIRCASALTLALFMQQCTFLMHDSLHNQITRNRHYDRWFGVLYGTLVCGLNANLWKFQHNLHHAMPNAYSSKTSYTDPQMLDDTPEFSNSHQSSHLMEVLRFVCPPLKILPLMSCTKRENPYLEDWFALILHLFWFSGLLLKLDNYVETFAVFALTTILHLVLCLPMYLSHTGKRCFRLDTISDTENWYKVQIESTRNLMTSPYLDWLFGGFNFHIEHHLFPNLPRRNLRRASWHVRELCEQLGLDYEEVSPWNVLFRRNLSKHERIV